MTDSPYVGSALYLQWVTSSATITFLDEFRTFSYTPTINYLDATAGTATSIIRVAGMKDGQASLSGVAQVNGTAMTNALVEGQLGTLTWGPEGTAGGKAKHAAGFYSLGVKWTESYNNITEYTVDWQQNGPRTDGTF